MSDRGSTNYVLCLFVRRKCSVTVVSLTVFILLVVIIRYSYNSAAHRTDTNLLYKSRDGRFKSPRVYIVEEHHEVIPYWVEIVKANAGQKAILIHVDAHSDMDYPEIVEPFPVGRQPKTSEEIMSLMQANDVFIQSAIIAQLLNTVYVIYPNWISTVNQIFEVSLGITMQNNTKHICICLSPDAATCRTRSDSNGMNDTVIRKDQCLSSWMFTYFELSSKDAANILKYSEQWSVINQATQTKEFNKNRPIILDIDEDFFGVHLASQSLLKSGIRMTFIHGLDQLIQILFCPKSYEFEAEIDEWFRLLLNILKSGKFSPSKNVRSCFSTFECIKGPLMEAYAVLQTKQQFWACKDIKVEDVFRNLSKMLYDGLVTGEQYEAIERIGICLSQAWSTYRNEPLMHLCLGHNTPEASLVEEFLPNITQMENLIVDFTRILLSLPFIPDLITISRSSRDGYTPRWMQYYIELLIISSLKTVFKFDGTHIYYSERLAGGHQGWYRRFL